MADGPSGLPGRRAQWLDQLRSLTLNEWLLLLAIGLIELPNAFTPPWNQAVVVLALLPLWWLIVRAANGARGRRRTAIRQAWRGHRWLLTALGIFGLLQSVAFIRAPTLTPLRAPLILDTGLLLAVVVFWFPARAESRHRLGWLVVGSLWAAVALNLLLAVLGLRSGSLFYGSNPQSESLMLGLIGLRQPAVLFPLAPGVNGFGVVIGAAWVTAALAVWQLAEGTRRLWWLAGLSALAVFMLALTDSRGPSIAAALTILLILIPGKAVRRLLPVMVFVPIVLPVVLVGATSGALGQETGLLVGAEQAPVLQLSGRTQIWSAALAELAEPVPGHLVGFGYAGHVAAGLSEQFSQVRSLAADPNSLGAHNLVLQLVLDSGYFGAALMLLTLGLIIRDLGRLASVDDNGLGTVFLGLMCYSVLIGALERVPTVYTEELFVLMLLTAGYVIGRQAAVTAGGVGPN